MFFAPFAPIPPPPFVRWCITVICCARCCSYRNIKKLLPRFGKRTDSLLSHTQIQMGYITASKEPIIIYMPSVSHAFPSHGTRFGVSDEYWSHLFNYLTNVGSLILSHPAIVLPLLDFPSLSQSGLLVIDTIHPRTPSRGRQGTGVQIRRSGSSSVTFFLRISSRDFCVVQNEGVVVTSTVVRHTGGSKRGKLSSSDQHRGGRQALSSVRLTRCWVEIGFIR